MTLGELIKRLESLDPTMVFAEGFSSVHSDCFDDRDVSFTPANNVTVASMLANAQAAMGATLNRWRGGKLVVNCDTEVYLGAYGIRGEPFPLTFFDVTQIRDEELCEIIREIWWMARRYADGRNTVVTSTLNDMVRKALQLGISLKPDSDATIWARDGMGNRYAGLSVAEATPGTPEAIGEHISAKQRQYRKPTT